MSGVHGRVTRRGWRKEKGGRSDVILFQLKHFKKKEKYFFFPFV